MTSLGQALMYQPPRLKYTAMRLLQIHIIYTFTFIMFMTRLQTAQVIQCFINIISLTMLNNIKD